MVGANWRVLLIGGSVPCRLSAGALPRHPEIRFTEKPMELVLNGVVSPASPRDPWLAFMPSVTTTSAMLIALLADLGYGDGRRGSALRYCSLTLIGIRGRPTT